MIDKGLQEILNAMGGNYVYSNILRSIQKNKEVGGWSGSMHVDWDKDGDSQAVDILRNSFSGSPESEARKAFAQGATGVGIYNTHIHVDNNPARIENPYFKDYRTVKTKFDEQLGITFDYFKNYYNKELAILRQGRNDNVSRETIDENINTTKFSNNTLLSVGVAVVTIFTLLGLFDD